MEKYTSVQKNILNSLKAGATDYWRLFANSPCLVMDFNEALKELIRENVIVFDYKDAKFLLTKEGDKHARNLSGAIWPEIACSRCAGRTVDPDYFKDFKPQFLSILKQRPPRAEQYDQAFAPLDVVNARVNFMHMCGDLEGRKIFLVGDGDFLGPCLAITGLPAKVTILDIDQRIVSIGEKIKHENNIDSLEYILYDATQELPQAFVGQYDCFFVDPTPTDIIMRLFITRASRALHLDGAGYVALSHMEASLSKWRRIHQYLLSMNFVITDIIRNFNTYDLQGEWLLSSDWRVIREFPVTLTRPADFWYYSAMMRVQSVEPLYVPEVDPIAWTPSLYMDDELLG
ncbi:MAG: bis-aminopropyl spermidine synthase family protein [Ktedonobacteraceae bacterium]